MSEFIKYGNAVKGVVDGTEKAVLKIAAKIASQAKVNAPVDQDALRPSIGYSTKTANTASPELSEKPKEGQALVGSNVGYALYQELGTRKMAAQPYLRPAVESVNGSPAVKIIEKYMDEEITKAIMKGKTVSNL